MKILQISKMSPSHLRVNMDNLDRALRDCLFLDKFPQSQQNAFPIYKNQKNLSPIFYVKLCRSQTGRRSTFPLPDLHKFGKWNRFIIKIYINDCVGVNHILLLLYISKSLVFLGKILKSQESEPLKKQANRLGV